MPDSLHNSSSGSEKAHGSWLFFAVVGAIILAIVLFLTIRPIGSDSGGGGSNPAPTSIK